MASRGGKCGKYGVLRAKRGSRSEGVTQCCCPSAMRPPHLCHLDHTCSQPGTCFLSRFPSVPTLVPPSLPPWCLSLCPWVNSRQLFGEQEGVLLGRKHPFKAFSFPLLLLPQCQHSWSCPNFSASSHFPQFPACFVLRFNVILASN